EDLSEAWSDFDETEPEAKETGSVYDETDSDLSESGSDFTETEPAESVNGSASSINAVLSSAQITEEIRQMEEQAVTSFEQNVSQETGYQTLRFLHRTITDTPDWYCMEVLCYTASADGFEQVNHFTINKKTGERVELEDLFYAGADYITPISEEIISQMRARMKENPEVEYWIDSEDDPESDFSRIRDDQDFYIDDEGRLVICFNELEAAPMSMGTVEFIIPDKVLAPIRIN
ncbi:MAG: RsiV family protein, partial [Sarcina sp.]|nr:RsiV family protein [Sarcina sp.]